MPSRSLVSSRMARTNIAAVVVALGPAALLVLARPCSAELDPVLLAPAVEGSAAILFDDECAAGPADQPGCAANALQLRRRLLTAELGSPPRFPQMPSFAAKLTEHPLTYSQIEATFAAPYNNMTYTYDADRQISELAWDQQGIWFLGPKYATLPNREFWTQDRGGGVYVANHGAICVQRGYELRTQALRVLWDEMKADKGTYLGEAVVRGEPCGQWLLRNASVGNMSMCVGVDGIPRSVTVEAAIAFVGITNIGVGSHNLTFSEIRTGDASEASSLQPPVCPSWRKACEDKGTATLQTMRFHNGEPAGHVSDRDTLDWNSLVFTSAGLGGSHKYLSVYDVEVNTSYGPWRECDFDFVHKKAVCSQLPAEYENLVSRTSSELIQGKPGVLGDHGQCEENDVVGSWLLFPHEGKCSEGQEIGDHGCTWKLKKWKVFEYLSVIATLKAKFGIDAGSIHAELTSEKPPFRKFQRKVKEAMAETQVVEESK